MILYLHSYILTFTVFPIHTFIYCILNAFSLSFLFLPNLFFYDGYIRYKVHVYVSFSYVIILELFIVYGEGDFHCTLCCVQLCIGWINLLNIPTRKHWERSYFCQSWTKFEMYYFNNGKNFQICMNIHNLLYCLRIVALSCKCVLLL